MAVYESLTTGDDESIALYGVFWYAQTFTPSTLHTITKIEIYGAKQNSPSGNLIASIQGVDNNDQPDGNDLCIGQILASTVGAGNAWISISLGSGTTLFASTKYALVVRLPDGDGTNRINWRRDSDNGYASGNQEVSIDSGLSWTADTGKDWLFREYGYEGSLTGLTDGLQGFWKCNDDAATTVVLDYSGNGNNGTASANTSVLNTTGKINDGFKLDLSDTDYFTGTDLNAVDLAANQDISIAVWAKWTDPNSAAFQTLYHKFDGTDGLVIYADEDGVSGNIVMRAVIYFGGVAKACQTASAFDATTSWFLTIVTVDRDGNLTIYIDDGTNTGNIDISAYDVTDSSNSQALAIGEDCDVNANFENWNGYADCVAVWNRVLTTAERAQLWNDGEGTEDFSAGLGIRPTDRTYTKRFVAIAGNELWYENDSNVMTKLTASASSGELDCTEPLDMFELDGKVFIVNGTRKKIYDPTNVKLSTTDLGANPPDHGTVLEGAGGAKMVVDYITNLDNGEACLIYGQQITSVDFINTETVTGTDDDDNAISFDLDAAPVDPPHWYDWTTSGNAAGNDTTFGELSEKAMIGCNYRGRATISGNSQFPHQWYMMRAGNPFDALYGGDDAQSAVAGNNADAGELGDTVRALIPWKDDYLIFGCVNTMWYLTGDPCSGGEINELDLTTGIYGAKAWCFDSDGNFYFQGTNGLYRSKLPNKPVCISEFRLPKLMGDESINPTTHRITLHYDRLRAGIILAITTIADGTNSNYWYDLRVLDEAGIGGFFPEEYPEECAIYSGHYYEAQDPDYRKLIVGCNDGYLRFFDDTAKNDVLGDDTGQLIDAYVTFGPIAMSDNPKRTGKLTGLDCVLAGGGLSGGSQSDSDDVTYDMWIANSAAKILEQLSADTAPRIAGTFTAPGRRLGSIVRKKIKGMYAGIKLQNDTAAQTWAFEKLIADFKPSGRLK